MTAHFAIDTARAKSGEQVYNYRKRVCETAHPKPSELDPGCLARTAFEAIFNKTRQKVFNRLLFFVVVVVVFLRSATSHNNHARSCLPQSSRVAPVVLKPKLWRYQVASICRSTL